MKQEQRQANADYSKRGGSGLIHKMSKYAKA